MQKIDKLDVEIQSAMEALSRPAESQPFCQKACQVYADLLRCTEESDLQGQELRLLQELRKERQEVKEDIAYVKERLKSLRSRYRILRCLGPSQEEARQMNAKELRLCLHIHRLPQPGSFLEKQDILNQLVLAGICS